MANKAKDNTGDIEIDSITESDEEDEDENEKTVKNPSVKPNIG